MAFWRFGLASESAIDALLKGWDDRAPGSGTPENPAGGNGPSLEQLLEEEDLLQETKSGHTRLIQYLAAPHTLRRLLAYISGEAFQQNGTGSVDPAAEDADPPPPVPPKDDRESHSNTSMDDRTEEGGSASTESPLKSTKQLPSKPGQQQLNPEDHETARRRLKYPYLCMEILAMDPWQVTEAIFRDTDTYLVPFWQYILDASPETLAQQSVQIGHWAKVNIQWLNSQRAPQMVTFIKSIPDVIPRLLVHLPYASPVADILTKLVNIDDLHPQLDLIAWLHLQKLVPRVLDLLDPVTSPVEAHTPAGEFLRGIIAAASAASASKQQQQQQAASQGNKFGGEISAAALGLPGPGHDNPWLSWPNNTLVRELASEATIQRLLAYMLDSCPIPSRSSKSRQRSSTSSATTTDETPPTPTAARPGAGISSLPMTAVDEAVAAESPREVEEEDEAEGGAAPALMESVSTDSPLATPEAATSSLLNSLALIIDVIRKNNSDFTELQILQYLERTNEADLDEDSDEESEQPRAGREGEGEDAHPNHLLQHGPSLVDLGPLLVNITRRLPDLHQLLLHPRSDITPLPTTLQLSPTQEPLTFERFRICELYAELLHCSNMAILNRPLMPASDSRDDVTAPTYDPATGRILGTRKEAFERLSKALNTQPPPSPSPAQGGNADGMHEQGHDEDDSMVEDIAMGADDAVERPETAVSDVTSSYTSGASDLGDSKEDSEDVLELLGVSTEDLSLDDDPQLQQHPSPRIPSLPSSPSPQNGSASAQPSDASPKSTVNGATSKSRPSNIDVSGSKAVKPEETLLPGPGLKKAFIELDVIPGLLDLFFDFPWNNFLHNVVYDLIQQVFNGRLDSGPNRELCLAVFREENGLLQRILRAVEQNNELCRTSNGVRLGHMGHITLISEEIVKLFYNNPNSIVPHVALSHADGEAWERYVEGPLHETRERDMQPLGGGISIAMHASASAGSGGGTGIGLLEDDEFPGSVPNRYFANENGDDVSPPSSPDKTQFARYLAAQVSGDLGVNHQLNSSTSSSSSSSSGSSSSEELHELGHPRPTGSNTGSHHPPSAAVGGHSSGEGSRRNAIAATWFGSEHKEGDSAFDDYDDEDDGQRASGSGPAVPHRPKPHVPRQERFGFDGDAFDPSRFGTGDSDDEDEEDDGAYARRGDNDDDDDDDDGFGPFSDSFAARPSPSTQKRFSFDDNFSNSVGNSASTSKHGNGANGASGTSKTSFTPTQKLTPADWNSSFRSSSDAASGDMGAFGSFGGADDNDEEEDNSPLPSPNGDFDDDDFGDFATADDSVASQGDYDFSETNSAPAQAPTVSAPPPAPAPVTSSSPARASASPGKARSPPPPIPSRSVDKGASNGGSPHFNLHKLGHTASSSSPSPSPPPPRSGSRERQTVSSPLFSPTHSATGSQHSRSRSRSGSIDLTHRLSPSARPLPSPGLPGEEVVGPGVHEGAHISRDGLHIEAEIEVDGRTVLVQVPKDELALHPEIIR